MMTNEIVRIKETEIISNRSRRYVMQKDRILSQIKHGMICFKFLLMCMRIFSKKYYLIYLIFFVKCMVVDCRQKLCKH